MDILSTRQAATYLGISANTVKYHLYTARTLKPSGKVGGSLFFVKSDLDAFKKRNKAPGRPKKGQK